MVYHENYIVKPFGNQTGISIYNDYRKIDGRQILIIAQSGAGKTLATEGLMEEYWKNGYQVICLADPKGEWELAYQMFKPEEKYHLEHLRKIGREPSKKPVKLYHPFTFNIPLNKKLPDINFFTFSIKEIGEKELALIAETKSDSDAIKLFKNTQSKLNSEEGIYSFAHRAQKLSSGKREGKEMKPDWDNFGLLTSSSDAKALKEISRYLQPFKQDYFLAKENCKYNLNWKELLADQKNYHVFLNSYIKSEKRQALIILALLSGIFRNREFIKHPLLIVIPEIRLLCEFNAQGYKEHLAGMIKNALSQIRSIGKGMTSILDSQVFSDIEKTVRDSATVTFLGTLGGGDDMEKVAKAYNYKRDIRDQLKRMPYPNSYLIVGQEDEGPVTLFFSSSCHAEPHYNFIEKYRKEYPLKSYKNLYYEMLKMFKDEEKKLKEKVKRQQKEEKEKKEREKRKKEIKREENQEKKKKKQQTYEKLEKTKLQVMKMIYEMKHDENIPERERTNRKIAKKYGLNHVTVANYLRDYEKILEKEKEKDAIPNSEEIKSGYNEKREKIYESNEVSSD